MIKVVFVCLGNICRSPVAEGIFKNIIKDKGFQDRIYCDSAGTSAYHIGENPDHRTIKNAKKNGIELSHKARQFKEEDFENFDFIIALDKSNLEHILDMKPAGAQSQVFLMREFDDKLYMKLDVPDPYFGGEEGFQEVFDILEKTCKNFLDYLIDQHLQ